MRITLTIASELSASLYLRLMELLIETPSELFLWSERLGLGLCPIGGSPSIRLDLKNARQMIALNASMMVYSEKRDGGPGALF